MATQFSTLDADDQPVDLVAGIPFQTFWEMEGGARVPLRVSHPWNSLDLFSADDLARWCITATEVPDPLPAEVPMYRVAIVLAQQGLTSAVTDYIAGLSEPEKTVAQTLWEKAPNLVVAGDFALQVKAALALSDEQYRTLIQAAVDLAL